MRIIVFDIDGVITDGAVIIDYAGKESKRVNMKDVDAIYELNRKGYVLCAVTAEKNEFTSWVAERFPWSRFYDGVSDKAGIIQALREEDYDDIIYIGDGKKDISAFEYSDYKICPSDAIREVCERADYVLNGAAGTGALWEMISVIEAYEKKLLVNEESEWEQHLEEHCRLISLMQRDAVYKTEAKKAAKIILDALKKHKKVVIFGNGGSAADSQHIAAEFMGRFRRERQALDVEALTVNTSILTAIGNDYSFEEVFSRQVEGMLGEEDVAIGISTSGTSKNVRMGLDQAKRMGAQTVLLTGDYKEKADYSSVLCVKSNDTARIQEIHILTGHFWADYVEKRMMG